MERDLTNREWLAYWTKVAGEVADAAERTANSAQWADELCKRVGATRREFIQARESGKLVKAFGEENAVYLAAIEAGFIEE
jgi:hypothetical protein